MNSEENSNVVTPPSEDGGLILVTGGSGLVGNELIHQLLADGKKVKAIYNNTPINIQHENLIAVKCNVLDVTTLQEVMQGVTHVYHCAAIVSFSPKNKQELFKINIEGTANIVNAALDAGIRKLVHVSSVSALGRLRNNEMITEEMNWSEETSNSVYGKSKYLGEMEVWRGIGEGLEAVIVNPSTVLGGDNWERGSSEIFKSAYDEFAWYSEGINGFVDVKDVTNAMILLMNSDITSERFILSSENVPYQKVFADAAKCFGKKPAQKKVTPFLAELVWRLEAFKNLFKSKQSLLTKETARTAMAKVYFDNNKFLTAFPQFRFIPISETIQFTCATLQKKYNL